MIRTAVHTVVWSAESLLDERYGEGHFLPQQDDEASPVDVKDTRSTLRNLTEDFREARTRASSVDRSNTG